MNRAGLLTLAISLAIATPTLAVPLTVAHQGELSDKSGPVSAIVEMSFRLWDAETNGAELWAETRFVEVANGQYSVLLGSMTPISDVLMEAETLFLEISVDDEVLEPRLAVGSAPYAVVAHTAENLSGGTVDASSISVDGGEVIDSDGAWVGGAESIQWSSISGMSCADGDRPVWNGTSSLWECGSEVVGLDRLDVAGGSDGDVLTLDGGVPTWEDVDWVSDISLYTVTATSQTSSEVSCNAGDLMTGGGCNPGGSGYVRYSYPDGNTWRCYTVHPNGDPYNVTAHAICLDLP